MSPVLLRDVIATLDAAYPPHLAEDWDVVGLSVGDPDQPVEKVLLAVDATAVTVDEAITGGADLLLTHHPLLLRGVTSVAADTMKGALVHRLIRAGTAVFSAHTNADRATAGVNDALAAAAGLVDTEPLEPAHDRRLDKIVTFVPTADAERVLDALAEAGAGRLGDYDRCAFTASGVGTFRPGAAAHPAIGETGQIERVEETRLEMVLDRSRRRPVLEALHASHPYEEPAFDVLELADLPTGAGLGRVGRLPHPIPLRGFVEGLDLPPTPAGIRVSGDPDRTVRRVAVVGGAGDSTLQAARDAGVDVLVTADLRHHPALDNAELSGPALVDPGHWASEWPWLPYAERLLVARFRGELDLRVSTICTDPWSFRTP